MGYGGSTTPSPRVGSATEKKDGQQNLDLRYMPALLKSHSRCSIVCVLILPRFPHLQAAMLAKDFYHVGSESDVG